MNYLTLGQVMILAESVTGIEAKTLNLVSRIDLLSSAVAAPSGEFAGQEFYVDFFDKAAVLCHHIVKNHALPDGNKRLAWLSLVMFCRINDFELECSVDESVDTIVNLASDELSQEDLAIWIRKHSIEKKF